jgi:hypothetical protein
VGLVFVDLGVAHISYQFLLDPKLATGSARILAAPDSGPYRLFSSLPNLHPSVYRFKERPFAQVVTSVWSSLVPNTGILYGFDYMQEIDALSRTPYDLFLRTAAKLPPEKFYPLLETLNVKYISSVSPLPKGELTLVRQFPEGPLWLYRLNRPARRVHIASFTRYEEDAGKTLDVIARETFDPFEEVVLDEPVSLSTKKRLQTEAEIVRYENQTVMIKASLNSAGILVLTDSFYPGWKAYVDGKEEKILRANLFFRAVPLTAGEHTVEFRYEPRSFAIGLAISIATLVGLIVTSIIFYIRERKRAVAIIPAY